MPNDLAAIRWARQQMYTTVQSCRSCDRSELKAPAVGRGPIPCERMIVTDTPGSIPDHFEGKLTNAGLPSLRSWYVTGAVKCRQDTPEYHQLVACHRTIRAELEVVDPSIVLLLGTHALFSTGVKSTLNKCHGRPFVPPMGPYIGRTCFPTYHPAGVWKDEHVALLLKHDLSTLYGLLTGSINLSSVQARVGRAGKLDLSVEARVNGRDC